jgi:hypothetical protein
MGHDGWHFARGSGVPRVDLGWWREVCMAKKKQPRVSRPRRWSAGALNLCDKSATTNEGKDICLTH